MYYYNKEAKIAINLDSVLYVEKDKYSKNTIVFYMKNPVQNYTKIWVAGNEAEFQKVCKMLLDMNTKVWYNIVRKKQKEKRKWEKCMNMMELCTTWIAL